MTGLEQMNILMVLDFYCQIAFQRVVSIYKDKAVHFFQGLCLKLVKRNKILCGARGPDNVYKS